MDKPPMSMRTLRRVHKMGSSEAWHEYNRRGQHGRPRRDKIANFSNHDLKTWLKLRKHTYLLLANRLNRSQKTIANWAQGKFNPPDNLVALLRALDDIDGVVSNLPPLPDSPKDQPKSDPANPIKFDPFKNNF